MYKLIAIILLLAGCTPGERVLVTRASENGRTVFDSRVTIGELSARFECRISASGQCHYALFDPDCTDATCSKPPLQAFAVAAGGERTFADPPHGVHVCMRPEAGAMTAACAPGHAAGTPPAAP
ncbi:MAG: hypothetical protein BGP10_00465 [Rhodanobacter sp. 68-29]|nr:hypothetical protein [Rhodanobacter sp.]ODU73727.1 MAG: hypothetical protein ABT17_10615 [Rhodanobacter sp. SCN 69-32]OJY59461.1 MAG: hypothetical protein BGP10_00465 [Rhodanobacter sp. 68-29]